MLTWFSGKLGYPFHNPGSGVSVSDWIIDLARFFFVFNHVPCSKYYTTHAIAVIVFRS